MKHKHALIAQLVERRTYDATVQGSNPCKSKSGWVPERSKGVDLSSTASASWVRIPPQPYLKNLLTAIKKHGTPEIIGSIPMVRKILLA